MAIGDVIVGIDIGTSKVSAVMAEINNFNQLEVVATSECKCLGMKKSKIVDENEVSTAITKVISDIEQTANVHINSAYISILGKYVTIVQNSVLKDAKDKFAGISSKDVNSSIIQLKDIDIPDDKIIIDIVTNDFLLDNGRVVDDPVGMLCSSFTIRGQVLLAEKSYVRQLTGIFKKINIEIQGIVSNVLAQRQIVLEKNELADNVMILDIGAGNTDIGIFNGLNFVYTNTVPIGGDSIANDIALVFNISEEEADRLRKQYGLALKSFIDNDTEIMLNTYKGEEKNKIIKCSELVEVIEARIEEIFTIINKEVTNAGLKQSINNVVLTGQGITSISKSDMVGKIVLNVPVKISAGRQSSTVKQSVRSSYAIISYIASRPFTKNASSKIDVKSNESFIKVLLNRIKEFFYT